MDTLYVAFNVNAGRLNVHISVIYYCEVCEDIPPNMCKDHCVSSCYIHVHSKWHCTCCGDLMHVVGERPCGTWLHLCWHHLCLKVGKACQKPVHLWCWHLFQGMHWARVVFSRGHLDIQWVVHHVMEGGVWSIRYAWWACPQSYPNIERISGMTRSTCF